MYVFDIHCQDSISKVGWQSPNIRSFWPRHIKNIQNQIYNFVIFGKSCTLVLARWKIGTCVPTWCPFYRTRYRSSDRYDIQVDSKWPFDSQGHFGPEKVGKKGPNEVTLKKLDDAVDDWNPAPVEVGRFIPLFTRLYTSQVVQDFFHQQHDCCSWWIQLVLTGRIAERSHYVAWWFEFGDVSGRVENIKGPQIVKLGEAVFFKWAQEFLENYLVLCLKKWSWPWIKAFRLLHAAWPKGLISNTYELLVPKACFDKFIIGLYVFKRMICKVFLGVFMIQHTNYNNIKLYVEAIMMHTIQTCACYDASIAWIITYDLTTYTKRIYIYLHSIPNILYYTIHIHYSLFSQSFCPQGYLWSSYRTDGPLPHGMSRLLGLYAATIPAKDPWFPAKPMFSQQGKTCWTGWFAVWFK